MVTSSSLAMRFGSSRSPVAPGTTSSGGTSVIFGEASLGDTVYDVWLDLQECNNFFNQSSSCNKIRG